ncbi:glycosyltransferase family 2 protein [Catellatospora vulcania]|uniref:glycosyltransferase family 2 protein n=1 Tax=Catellatospora vulcania TaxID=1460450 RepID=UPI0012D47E0C|nr:glycosyltransferase family 2 protein [Catellatospora vulcania]
MTAVDVSVIVPVYNTMPDLRRCMNSLVNQTIGHDRMEIIAVDDGSTDGSPAELARFAERYPSVKVIRQPNSGGPASPCNNGLGVATGRFVFFIGADDYMGPEALERMVDAADRYGSEVVLGKTVGVNSRFVYQEVFAHNAAEITFADSALSWSLGNIKLFSRDLVERHHLRYPEDMPIGSDFPFTLEACHRASRVSVVADYDCYYAVRRLNAQNVTHLSNAADRLYCLRRLMEFTVGLMPPGKDREAVLSRLFALEVAVVLRDDLLTVDPSVQQAVHDCVRELADRHLTAETGAELEVETRLRIAVVQAGDVDDLLAVIRQDVEQGIAPIVVEGDRWYAAYPGFRTPGSSLPDEVFEVTAHAAGWAAKLDATQAVWRRAADGTTVLAITARSPLPDLASHGEIGLHAEDLTAAVQVTESRPATVVQAEFKVADVINASAASGQRRSVRVRVHARGQQGSAPLRAAGLRLPRPLIWRRGLRMYAITPAKDPSGRLMISVVPMTPGRIMARLTRRR